MTFTLAGKITIDNKDARQALEATATDVKRVGDAARTSGGELSAMSAVGRTGTAALGGAVGGLVAGFAAAVAGAVSLHAIVSRSLSAFADFERSQLTTAQVLRATGGAAGQTAADIERMAQALGKSTLASTREAREAANQLLTFRSITGDTFERTMKVAQDLAAVGFGTLTSSTVQLAKALEAPTEGLSALRRVGVSFSEAQVELIKNFEETGRVADAQRVILEQVERQVGGAGVAAGGGLAGAWDSLSEATGRWFELVGSHISRLISLPSLINAVTGAVEGMNRAMGAAGDQAAELSARIASLSETRGRLAEAMERSSGAYRDDLAARIARIDDNLDRTREALKHAEVAAQIARNATAATARQAQDDIAAERLQAEITRLNERGAALRRTTLEEQTLQAAKRAGVALDSEAGQRIAALVRANHELEEAQKKAAGATRRGTSEHERQQQAVQRSIEALQMELDVVRELDPVQREMIQLRRQLAGATDEQRARAEELIAARIREETAASALQASYTSLAQLATRALDDMIVQGRSAADVMLNLSKAIASAALQAALLGSGPFAGIFGTTSSTGGFLGGLFKAIIPTFADGGRIVGPGTGRSDSILAAVSNGEFLVNAAATRRHLPLLEAINRDTGGRLPGFADGGLVLAPVSTRGQRELIPSGRMGTDAGSAGGVVNNFYVSTPSPQSFANDRITVLRGANRMMAQAGRLA